MGFQGISQAAESSSHSAVNAVAGLQESNPTVILWPTTAPDELLADQQRSAKASPADGWPSDNKPEYVLRTGAVMLDTAALAQEQRTNRLAARANTDGTADAVPERLQLGLFSDTLLDVELTSRVRPAPGVLSLNGRVPTSDFSTFSMTVSPASYLITYTDPESGRVYRVVGDSSTGYGAVTEIDPARMPPRIHEPPRVPPLAPSQQ
ncbi:hypothetical protein CCR91_09580 [Thiorhodovibrio winogradskyi]|nr:hypothetical protein [Thiorhodovibrio winogradskyi]